MKDPLGAKLTYILRSDLIQSGEAAAGVVAVVGGPVRGGGSGQEMFGEDVDCCGDCAGVGGGGCSCRGFFLGVQRQVFFVSLGGFDTHGNQVQVQGSLLGQLGPALSAFDGAMNQLGTASQVTTLLSSLTSI